MMRTCPLVLTAANKLSAVFKAFGKASKLDDAAMVTLKAVYSPPISVIEEAHVPFLNLDTNTVACQLVRHVLAFAFYSTGGRPTPAGRPLCRTCSRGADFCSC